MYVIHELEDAIGDCRIGGNCAVVRMLLTSVCASVEFLIVRFDTIAISSLDGSYQTTTIVISGGIAAVNKIDSYLVIRVGYRVPSF